MISENSAQSFENGEFLWDEALDSDIGYPASIELKNGDILTVFYARRKAEENCSILWVRWRLDDSSKEKNK